MTYPDLDSVEEISDMVHRFYRDVNADDLLGPVFNDIAHVDWTTHLPKLTAFWARALADTHAAAPLTSAHFERWLTLFNHTLAAVWNGPNTERARALARNVARVHATQLGVTPPQEPPDGRRNP